MIVTNKLFTLRQLLQNTRHFCNSAIKRGYDGPGKTTVNIINRRDNIDVQRIILINECIPVGFKLSNDIFVLGPMAIFPETILSWNVGSAKDINEESLSLFTALHPTLDVIVLGLETNYEYGKITEMKKLLIKHDIRVEILHVGQACGIYNFLVSEGRYVAAGLIPPLPQKRKLGHEPAKMRELTA